MLTVTDQGGLDTVRTFDANGNAVTTTDRLGNIVTRTYDSNTNMLLTETRSGSDTASADAPRTTRYAYDSENHLRYAVGADGAVTEYRYDSAGNQVSKLEYAEATYDVSALLATDPITESALNAWVSALADKSWVKRTDTHYDLRGNVERVVSSSVLSKYGEGTDSPYVITPGPHVTVTPQSDGLYRLVKTSSTTSWTADAHSSVAADGDFVSLDLSAAIHHSRQLTAPLQPGVQSPPAHSRSLSRDVQERTLPDRLRDHPHRDNRATGLPAHGTRGERARCCYVGAAH